MIEKLTAWAIGPALPFVAGGVVVALGLGAWTINDRAVDRTEKRVNGEWEAGANATAAAYAEAALEAAELREAQRADVDQATTRVIERTKVHYATRPIDRDAVCLPADRVRSVLSAPMPSPPPPSVVTAAKPTPTPGMVANDLKRPIAEELLILDARALAQCNIDKRTLFDAGWPKETRAPK